MIQNYGEPVKKGIEEENRSEEPKKLREKWAWITDLIPKKSR